MRQGYWMLGALAAWCVVMSPAQAFSGDPAKGKILFMTRGTGDKACMTCHPKGLSTGETYKGKDIPELTDELSEAKLRRKTLRFLKVQGMALSEAQLNDLLTFVQQIPSQGFGPVPREWQAHVKKTLGQ